MPIVESKVRRCEAVSEFVFVVELELPEPISFVPGQYLMVVMGDGDMRPFSIASTPAETDFVELHIGATADNPYAWEVIEKIRSEGKLTINLPSGDAGYLAGSTRPLLLLAGGTGFSYTWSILQAHLASDNKRPITLFWGGRKASDLYMHEELQKLAVSDSRFHYVPVAEEVNSENWPGIRGLLIPAVLETVKNLTDYDVYIAGRFEMVRVARDAFYAEGLPKEQLFGDALAFIE
ncbi:2-polyprenylphenol hydroxylase-like oxidoreductase [Idiomarina sp. A28L]|uniref:NAD(P)H-flavin reductase n=1 Tax=Idiomarina sp. A28L TaxID=1036674 RepID=UPI0002138B9B|nr:NAD(P)H-flavin reductase [Idiomarina sp. A28L]EGN75389.1 2-polyprenylphenol hydroxylase-like oxidoreductase [Idiomarina sp. A28L]